MESLRNSDIHSVAVIILLFDIIQKYRLTHIIDEWFQSGTFPSLDGWKTLVKSKIHAVESEKCQQKILKLDTVDGPGIVSFLNNFDRTNKALFLPGGLLLPFH